MESKTPSRVLLILAAASICVIGFFVYRSRTVQESQITYAEPLKGLMLAEKIYVSTPFLYVPNPADGAVLKKKGVGPFLKPTDSTDLQKRLLNDTGAQLRKGGVPFVHVPPMIVGADGYVSPPEVSAEIAEQIKRQGSLSLETNIEYINGIYFAKCRMKLRQPAYLTLSPSSQLNVTTWDAEWPFRVEAQSAEDLIPQIRKTAARAADSFVLSYRTANGLPNPQGTGFTGGSIGRPSLGMVIASDATPAPKKPVAKHPPAAQSSDPPKQQKTPSD